MFCFCYKLWWRKGEKGLKIYKMVCWCKSGALMTLQIWTWSAVYQIVMSSVYWQQVLCLAHGHHLSGHLGVTKTYNQILRHFFWLCLKKEVVQYCHTCYTCQLAEKANQVIPPAPLVPIPVIGEPFEHVIVDCVGPLPKTKPNSRRNQFLLTIMCIATRFPEAITLCKITATVVIKSLINFFFSTFGLPKVVQTEGTNFLSKLFTQVLKTLGISHWHTSAYHPESQEMLERFHLLKSIYHFIYSPFVRQYNNFWGLAQLSWYSVTR